MSVKRPRIEPAIAELIEQVRGDVPFERFVNSALSEHLASYRLDAHQLARLAREESGLSFDELRAMISKMEANAESGLRPRDGLSPAEERAFDLGSRYMAHLSEEDRITFRAYYWGG